MKTSRVEALCDGIFAIAMTLVVVSMNEVLAWPRSLGEKELIELLLGIKYDLVYYFQSFIILGLFWLAHHKQFHYIQRTDTTLIFINMAALMFVVLIPFSTILLGDHHNIRIAAFLFEVNILTAGLLFYMSWAYSSRRHRLVDPGLSSGIIRTYRSRSLVIPAISIAAICISFYQPYMGVMAYFLVPIVVFFQKE